VRASNNGGLLSGQAVGGTVAGPSAGEITVGAGLVERRFLRDWSRWPLAIAMDQGGCVWRVLGVRPGKLMRYPLSSAAARVDRTGENMSAWAKVTSSAADGSPMVLAMGMAGGARARGTAWGVR
jgi:hypothetical protein